ncbi:hypothetical protein ASG42_11210 [Rhizobium sp. Leaf391]|uniref:hypothetical protein n=1 Tax=Rhizobium sp. Leaf391 TaxID=1736360 RepID=UPI000712C0C0|nr:hypothetical protein [Rhizobium sp. Leaf391]KQS91052.1 hypothetical protein ASG42_11210 [Rhizobium sp. Leaf391]
MKPPHTASPRDHLDAVGKAIFGEAYKAPMARELRVDLRTFRRWVSDASDLAWNHGAIADLRAVLADEHAEVLAHEVELRTALEDLDMAIKSYRMREAEVATRCAAGALTATGSCRLSMPDEISPKVPK